MLDLAQFCASKEAVLNPRHSLKKHVHFLLSLISHLPLTAFAIAELLTVRESVQYHFFIQNFLSSG